MEIAAKPAARGADTRQALITTALEVFARDGYHAASTRDIADTAQVNQALIGYHFRSKEGLYLAVFEHIAAQIRARIGPLADAIEAALAAPPDAVASARKRRDDHLALLLRLTDGMVVLMSQQHSSMWAQLIVREQQAPSSAFTVLYDGFMGRTLELMTALVQRLRGTGDAQQARLMVVTLLGQVLVFRAARAGVLRHLGWDEIGAAELLQIQKQVRRNVLALLSSKSKG